MAQDRTKLWYLKNIVGLFSHLSAEEYKMIDQQVVMREIRRGDTLYLQGSPERNIYILKKGAVKITKGYGYSTINGKLEFFGIPKETELQKKIALSIGSSSRYKKKRHMSTILVC